MADRPSLTLDEAQPSSGAVQGPQIGLHAQTDLSALFQERILKSIGRNYWPLARELVGNLSSFYVHCVRSYIIMKKPQNLKFHCNGKDAGGPSGWVGETLSGFFWCLWMRRCQHVAVIREQGCFVPAGPVQMWAPSVKTLALTLEGALLSPDSQIPNCRNWNLEDLCLRNGDLISSYFIHSFIYRHCHILV